MLRICLLFLFCVHTPLAWLFRRQPPWNGLLVTYGNPFGGAFSPLPRTEGSAVSDGWTKISDGNDTPHFAGKRYVKDGDTAVVLIFDVNGYIAGIQAGFPSALPNGYPHPPLQDHPFVLADGLEHVTAYFIHPSFICSTGRSAAMFEQYGTGIGLYIQNGTHPTQVIEIPYYEDYLRFTNWTKGKCFASMGMHYWYNVRKDMDCDEYYPVFILYNGGKLNAFGWAFNADLSSQRYEHPPHWAFNKFINPVPDCLQHQGRLSTMHIYLTSTPLLNWC